MRTFSTVLALLAALMIAGNLCAAEKKKGEAKKARHAEWKAPTWLAKVNLTAEQKEKIKAVAKELAPKRAELGKKMQAILTDEQKAAKTDALKQAKADGKSPKETRALVEAAVKLTDEQKAKMAEVHKQMEVLSKELREKIMPILTPEQQEQLKKARAAHPEKPKKAKKAKAK